jgi:hypothetical protein
MLIFKYIFIITLHFFKKGAQKILYFTIDFIKINNYKRVQQST